MACCSLINWGPIDGWAPLAKYCDPGHKKIDVHLISKRSTDTSARIHYSLLQCYYLPVNVNSLWDSLSVIDSGSHSGAHFEAPLVDFCVIKIRQNFIWQHLKEKGMLKILAACHSGAPSPAGGPTHVRTVLNG